MRIPFRPPGIRSLCLALLLFAAGGALLLPSCVEDEDGFFGDQAALAASDACSPACGQGTRCVRDERGVPDCLAPTPGCGDEVCHRNAVCADGACEFDDRECPDGCASNEICIYGHCITAFTPSNQCAPLDECRARCGLDVVCIDHCEANTSDTCNECRDRLASCEGRDNCEGNANDCCPDRFCTCFPTNPGCTDTPCDLCFIEADGDPDALFQCVNDTPECSSCLQPFFGCRDELDNPDRAVVDCEEELCDCLSGDVADACR